jgi:hypothetical protein
MTLRETREQLVREHMEPENRHEFDVTLATFDHPRYEIVPTGEVHDGAEAVQRYFDESRTAFPDQRNELIALHHADDAVIAEYEGERYLVAMLGREANWVRNVRAAQGNVVLRHGHREAVHLDPVAPERRAPILKRYLELAPGARPHIPAERDAPLEDFERLAADYPVFQITGGQNSASTLRRA